jgi:hypothetical protein
MYQLTKTKQHMQKRIGKIKWHSHHKTNANTKNHGRMEELTITAQFHCLSLEKIIIPQPSVNNLQNETTNHHSTMKDINSAHNPRIQKQEKHRSKRPPRGGWPRSSQ